MNQDTIRIGIIGAGQNTKKMHIPGLKAIEGVEIVSVCNRSRASSERVAQEYNIPQVYDTWSELIAADDTDAIVIGTWPYMHCRLTVAVLAANKHVMCEARMARNVQEAQQMLAASHQKPHLVAQIVPAPHTLGVDKTIKQRLAQGYLGDVLAINVKYNSGAFIDPQAPMHWREDFDLSGFNIMLLGIMYEAVIRWVGEAVNVTARGKTFVKTRLDEEGNRRAIRIPDHLDVLADMACGAQAHIQLSNVTGLSGPPEIVLFGSEGTLRFSGDKLYGAQRGETELQEIAIAPKLEGGWRVEEEFINALRGQEMITHTDFETGVKYMAFIEAVTHSMLAGQTVSLPL